MKFEIPDSIIKQTTKCPAKFSCLTTGKCGDDEQCTVQFIDGENVLLLESKAFKDCPYRVPFGSGQLCTCPTHFAIKQKYGLPEAS